MKRLNDDNVRPTSNSEVESFFDDLLRRHPRLLLGIVLVWRRSSRKFQATRV